MPTYTYKCAECGKDTTAIRKINDRKTCAPFCCSTQMHQTITPMSSPMINAVSARHFDNYVCPVSDQVVTSARQKKEIEASHDLIVKEKGMFPPRKKKFNPELPSELKPEMAKQIAMQKSL